MEVDENGILSDEAINSVELSEYHHEYMHERYMGYGEELSFFVRPFLKAQRDMIIKEIKEWLLAHGSISVGELENGKDEWGFYLTLDDWNNFVASLKGEIG